MPPRIPRACRKHGCRNTTIHSTGYCPEHQNTGWENHQQGKTRHERGYGANWDKLKPLIKARDKGLYALRRLKSVITSKYPRHKLANDGTSFGAGQAIVTPNVIKGEMLSIYRQLERAGIVENFELFKQYLIVERNADNPAGGLRRNCG